MPHEALRQLAETADPPGLEPLPVRRRAMTRLRGPARPLRLGLTPLIDVIFLLLIYFVITASFAADEGVLTARLPRGSAAPGVEAPPTRPVRVTLDPVGPAAVRIALEGDDAGFDSFTALGDRLGELLFDPTLNPGGVYEPDNPVRIVARAGVRWQHVVNAFNAATDAGYRNVAFAQPR